MKLLLPVIVENRRKAPNPPTPSPARLEKLMREDYARWSKLVIDAKLKID